MVLNFVSTYDGLYPFQGTTAQKTTQWQMKKMLRTPVLMPAK